MAEPNAPRRSVRRRRSARRRSARRRGARRQSRSSTRSTRSRAPSRLPRPAVRRRSVGVARRLAARTVTRARRADPRLSALAPATATGLRGKTAVVRAAWTALAKDPPPREIPALLEGLADVSSPTVRSDSCSWRSGGPIRASRRRSSRCSSTCRTARPRRSRSGTRCGRCIERTDGSPRWSPRSRPSDATDREARHGDDGDVAACATRKTFAKSMLPSNGSRARAMRGDSRAGRAISPRCCSTRPRKPILRATSSTRCCPRSTLHPPTTDRASSMPTRCSSAAIRAAS